MKFIRRFDFSRQSLWMSLLVAVLLISTPLYAAEASGVFGEITVVDAAERVIEIDGVQYKLVLQAEIKNASDKTSKAISMTDLKAGQYVQFEVSSGNMIQRLLVFENGPPM